MGELLNEIKRASSNVTEAGKPAEVFNGTVTSVSPVAVAVDALSLPIPPSALSVPKHITEKEPLHAGDSVIVLRCNSGQRFVMLGRI